MVPPVNAYCAGANMAAADVDDDDGIHEGNDEPLLPSRNPARLSRIISIGIF